MKVDFGPIIARLEELEEEAATLRFHLANILTWLEQTRKAEEDP